MFGFIFVKSTPPAIFPPPLTFPSQLHVLLLLLLLLCVPQLSVANSSSSETECPKSLSCPCRNADWPASLQILTSSGSQILSVTHSSEMILKPQFEKGVIQASYLELNTSYFLHVDQLWVSILITIYQKSFSDEG